MPWQRSQMWEVTVTWFVQVLLVVFCCTKCKSSRTVWILFSILCCSVCWIFACTMWRQSAWWAQASFFLFLFASSVGWRQRSWNCSFAYKGSSAVSFNSLFFFFFSFYQFWFCLDTAFCSDWGIPRITLTILFQKYDDGVGSEWWYWIIGWLHVLRCLNANFQKTISKIPRRVYLSWRPILWYLSTS